MSEAIMHNKINIFYDILHDSYIVNFSVGDSCGHSFILKKLLKNLRLLISALF